MFNLKKLLGMEHPQASQQIPMRPMAQPIAPKLPQHEYMQYMNPDGTGGGFGPQNPSRLQVQPSFGMQGFGHGQEDTYTPYDALSNRSYDNQQTTQHGAFNQGSFQNPQQNDSDLLRRLLRY